ncbi:unnamed protein product [Albugo candida]|uniref:Uncharacterized protein n=1 Tax=Albugo candida TaxID=65357 RepID=A0A024GHP4_9STRA|nr:unnamed protein product [Albugo candida]|eukprot:CCI46388.1 unnamed protein product [Albugo candida]
MDLCMPVDSAVCLACKGQLAATVPANAKQRAMIQMQLGFMLLKIMERFFCAQLIYSTRGGLVMNEAFKLCKL